MVTCPSCGEENPPKFRLCGYCGTPLAAPAPSQEQRKLVTLLFCDLKGSTKLGEALDPESMREVMARYFDAMKTAIAKHGGTIEKYIGDAVMVVFGLPRIHEDDALRAVRAAAAMQEALVSLNAELDRTYGITLANRIGVNTGEVVAGDASLQQRLVTGDAVNVAARLEQAAGECETLLGELTYRLVRGAVDVEAVEPLTLKGKTEPIPAYRLVAVKDMFENDPLAVRQTLVGRSAAIAELVDMFDEVAAAGRPRTVWVLGEAGVGKTRLIDEFAAIVRDRGAILRGRCLSYGEGITFWPIVEALKGAAGIEDTDDAGASRAKVGALVGVGHEDVIDRLVSLMGLAPITYQLPELFWAVRRLFELLGARRPVALVVEDVHWAEKTLHDLLDSLVDVDAPALLVAVARPDVVEQRPAVAEQQVIAVERLGPAETAVLIGELLGGPVDSSAEQRLVEASDGNPLFAQQLVAMLQDDGLLTFEGARWTLADMPSNRVPPTISALLSARIDMLDSADRGLLDPASVIGHVFPLAAVSELGAGTDVLERADRLTSLRYLTRPDEERATEFRQFHHVLIRESVYESLLKRQRASLHERFVQWADRVNGDRAVEYEEILGYHLEQAHRYLVELAPADEHALELGRNGAQRLRSAGRRAFVRGDMPAAASLLGRAYALLPEQDPIRFELAPDLAEALMQVGQFDAAREVVDSTAAAATAAGRPSLAGGSRVVGELIRLFAGDAADGGWSDSAQAVAEEVIAEAQREQQHATLARAFRLLAWVDGKACRYGRAAASLQHAVEHARAAGDLRQERRAASAFALTSAYGPTPVDEALARCADVADRVAGDRQAEAAVMCVAAHLEAMRGATDVARLLCLHARSLFEELGLKVEAASMVLESGRVELLTGDYAAAEAELRRGYTVLVDLEERYLLSTLAGLLARAVLEQGRFDEADDLAHLAEAIADDDDVDAQVHWRCIRGRVLAHGGDPAGAEMTRSAVDLVSETDAVLLKIDALLAHALALEELGDPAAPDAFRRAQQLALEKGSSVLAARAGAALTPAARDPTPRQDVPADGRFAAER